MISQLIQGEKIMEKKTSCLFGNRVGEKRIFIEITDICNMKCKHCMNKSGSTGVEGLEKEDLFTLLEELVSHDFKRLYISGGEPLLYRSIDEVLKYAHKLGLKITLATNGWNVIEHIEVIKKCVDVVSISLDGIGPIHDTIREMKGSYVRAIEALQVLDKNGVTTKISSMIWKKNINQLEDIVLTAKSVGVSKVNFAILVPVGRAEDNEEILLDKELYSQIYKKIDALTSKYKKQIEIEIKRQHGISQECLSCPGGDLILHINAHGKISPCSWIAKIECRDFSVMWKPGMLKKCMLQFNDFKRVLEKRENKYEYTGCPAMAYIHNGDYLAEGPINDMNRL